MGLNEALIAEYRHEAKTTRKMLERVPLDAFGWKPHEKSMTMERLTAHITELFGWPRMVLTTDELDFSKMDHTPLKVNSISDLVQLFDANVAAVLELLKDQADAPLFQNWKLRSGDQIFFEMPRISVLRLMVFNHSIHHRGQLSVYLRLKNVPLPSIYGPSADEAM
jgi:uncharacterized damage-inducible protein DinB